MNLFRNQSATESAGQGKLKNKDIGKGEKSHTKVLRDSPIGTILNDPIITAFAFVLVHDAVEGLWFGGGLRYSRCAPHHVYGGISCFPMLA